MTTLAALCTALALLLGAGEARAAQSNFIVMEPGDSVGRTFYLDQQQNSYQAHVGKLFLVSAVGPADSDFPGILTITVGTSASVTTPGYLDYELAVVGYALGGAPYINNQAASWANKITMTYTINAQFGVALVYVFMIDVTPDLVVLPAPFTINFALAVKK